MSNSIDFRSNQIQTGRLIVASGSGQSSNCLVVYGINAEGSPANQGIIDTAKFNTASIGTDTFFFVSGTVGDRGTINPTVSVFGGDLHISGNLTIDGTGGGGGVNYFENTSGTTITSSGSLYLSGGLGATFLSSSFGGDITGSFTQGYLNIASGDQSHAEGRYAVASASYSHAEGTDTLANGYASHAEGGYTKTSHQYAHSEGYYTTGSGLSSHAEGWYSESPGLASHAEGIFCIAYGTGSHAGGLFTVASGAIDGGAPTTTQAVFGKYNTRANTHSLFVVGDGVGDEDAGRHDILRVNSGSVDITGSLIATGITGSISGTVGGLPFIVGGTNITANYNTSGQWAITGSGGGAATTMGHSWERPDPVTAGVGAVFINTDDGGEYVSSGTAPTNGVPLSGWMRRLPSGMATTRAAIVSTDVQSPVYPYPYVDGTRFINTNKISLKPYSTNNCTFALHYYWNATPALVPYYLDTLLTYGANNDFADGAAAFYYQAGGTGSIDLILHANGANTFITSSIPPVAGYNTLVFAPVSYGGNHYWRWSYNGSAAVDTPMTNPYLAPVSYDYFQVWGRGDNLVLFGGKGIDAAAWNTLLSGSDMAILSNPPAGTYGLLETANTGPATIRIEANRFDSANGAATNNYTPLQAMPIHGSNRPADVWNYNKKVNIP